MGANYALTNENRITDYKLNHDECGNLTTIYFTTNITVEKVYLTYKYNPNLYSERVAATWATKLAKDIDALREVLKELGPKTDPDTEFANYVTDIGKDISGVNVLSGITYEKGIYGKIEALETLITEKKSLKEAAIRKFD
jgi:hypothetical protein